MGALADLLLREPGPPPGAPGPVGAFAARHRTLATLVTRAADGSFEYGDEVEVTVSLGRWMELLEPGTLYWSGIEVRYLKTDLRGFHIIAALDPVEWNWFASAPLRRAYKETGPRKAAITAAIREGRSLRDLPSDPFEQNRQLRVARLDDPMRLHWENGAAFEGGYLRGSGPADKGVWRRRGGSDCAQRRLRFRRHPRATRLLDTRGFHRRSGAGTSPRSRQRRCASRWRGE